MPRRNDHSAEDADTEIDVAPISDVDLEPRLNARRRAGRQTDRFDNPAPIAPVWLPNERGVSAARPQVGARYLNYKIRRRLARGSMGLVYEAEHLHLERRVAIKFLNPQLLSSQQSMLRFLNEARAMARIDHPGVAAVHDFGQDATGNAYLVMEHLDGDSLAERLAAGAIDLRLALEIGAQIAEALAAAHDRHIIHRDLKPENVFVLDGEELRIKLVDFGVARPSVDGDRAGLRTATGCLVGTPAYMAPEQTYSLGVTAETDIYALGCLLFQMISGAPVFSGSVADLIDKHRHLRAPQLTGARPLPAELITLVGRMLDKRPSRRPRAGREVAARLRGIATDLGLRWADPLATTDRLDRGSVERAIGQRKIASGTDAPRPRAMLPPPTPARAPVSEITPLPFYDNAVLGTPQPFHTLATGSVDGAPRMPRRKHRSRGLRLLLLLVAIGATFALSGWLVATMAL